MIRVLCLSLLFSFCALLSAAELATAQEGGQPALSIEQPVFDFGTVSEGEKIEHQFTLKNAGQGLLRIDRVQPACGCTAAAPEKNELGPGEETVVLASFDTKGFRGYKEKRVQIYSNDPRKPYSIIEFRGNVKADVDVHPPRVYFGKVRKGEKSKKVLTIKVDPSTSVSVKEVIARSPEVGVEVEGSGPTQRVKVSLSSDIPVGVFKTRLAVRTTSRKNPVVNVPVFARVVGDLELEPSDASFGLLDGPLNKRVSRTLKLTNTADFPVKVLSVEPTIPSVEVESLTIKEGKRYDIVVTATEGLEGTLRGKVNVITDHPDESQKALSFSVYGIITPKGR